MSSNQKRRSKADGMKVRFPTVATRGFLFSALSASCQEEKYIRSGSRRKICQQRIKESLWDQGSSHLLSQMKVSIFSRFFATVCATPKTPTVSWTFFLSSMFCSTTPIPSDVAPVFQSSAPGTAIASPSLFLTKWHQSVPIVRRNRPTLQLPLKGPFQLCCIPTLYCLWNKP